MILAAEAAARYPGRMDGMQNQVDFSGLILGFSSAALYYMGEQVVEGRRIGEKNLPLARQNIDIILLLREKTSGNLNEDERQLIETVVHDLQLRYVQATAVKS